MPANRLKKRGIFVRRRRRIRLTHCQNILRKEQAILAETNDGRKKAMIWNLPGVIRTNYESGGWSDSICEINMASGYSIRSRKFHTRDAINESVFKLITHLLENSDD